MQPGIYADISNHDYHSGPGISKSQLDLVARAPALLEWSKQAPRLPDSGALTLGDAAHALILEPERFAMEYMIAPNVDKRTNDGKARWAAAMTEAGNRTLLSQDDGEKLSMMRESVMAHPEARRLIEAAGEVEHSIYWEDPETGVLCRCRPDKIVGGFLVDLKTTSDIDNFGKSVANYRYHVQDAFYSEGYRRTRGDFGGFLFLAVSSVASLGRYPVRLVMLDEDASAKGAELFRRDLNMINECQQSGEWPGVETISLPAWA